MRTRSSWASNGRLTDTRPQLWLAKHRTFHVLFAAGFRYMRLGKRDLGLDGFAGLYRLGNSRRRGIRSTAAARRGRSAADQGEAGRSRPTLERGCPRSMCGSARCHRPICTWSAGPTEGTDAFPENRHPLQRRHGLRNRRHHGARSTGGRRESGPIATRAVHRGRRWVRQLPDPRRDPGGGRLGPCLRQGRRAGMADSGTSSCRRAPTTVCRSARSARSLRRPSFPTGAGTRRVPPRRPAPSRSGESRWPTFTDRRLPRALEIPCAVCGFWMDESGSDPLESHVCSGRVRRR
jgi:hypothetical protein